MEGVLRQKDLRRSKYRHDTCFGRLEARTARKLSLSSNRLMWSFAASSSSSSYEHECANPIERRGSAAAVYEGAQKSAAAVPFEAAAGVTKYDWQLKRTAETSEHHAYSQKSGVISLCRHRRHLKAKFRHT